MTVKIYLKNNLFLFIFHILCMLVAVLYLNVIGVKNPSIILILFLWTIVLFLYLTNAYKRQKKHFYYLQCVMNNLEKKYLITQVIDRPEEFVEQFYFDLLRKAEKSMLEEITSIRHAHTDYREYIEQWVHEIKGPLTSLRLKCENDESGVIQSIIFEIGQIENYIEQALFFARSENMDKDFLIRKITLRDMVNAAVIQNKHLLVNNISLNIQSLNKTVYSDSKWLEFIVSQIIINSAKYKNEADSILKIYTETRNNTIMLKIEDNGIGISQSELPRIFDKGFTGTNGRNIQRSTGLGLYLCKQLCEKLGHEINITSTPGKGTTATIIFLDP